MSKTAREVLNNFYDSDTVVFPVDVIGIANAYGIEVYRANFKDKKDDVYGFIRKQDGKIEIYTNAANSLFRRRFTIAHELGHFFLHHDNDHRLSYMDLRTTVRTDAETEANRFAAELLMPENELRAEHAKLMFPTVAELSKRFGVSVQAMQIRLNSLKLECIT